MDIKHRISVNTIDVGFLTTIAEIGVEYKLIQLPGNGGRLITIFIQESDPRWHSVVELVKTQKQFDVYGEGDLFETIFSEDEIRKASWLRLISTFEQGYPQPKPYWPIKQLSYEIICPTCAIYKQTHPMRLAKEPSLGRKSFMSTIWAAEIFCTSEVILGLESIQAKGYEVWDALIHKTGQPSEKVRQLYVPGITSPGVIFDDDFKRISCSVCGTTKYYPNVKGSMKLSKEALLPDTDFMLTHEWFGNGLLAWREMIVSNRVAQLVINNNWGGIRFKVVEIVK